MNYRLLTLLALLLSISLPNYAANLTEVYQQALLSDPLYQQVISSRLATQEGVPISFSSLLPSFSAQLNPALSKQTISGAAATFEAGNLSYRGYTVGLNLNQTIFDFAKIANLYGARALSKQADANLSAATQELMVRVAKAYFTILQDEDNLIYSQANKTWLGKLLDQVRQQYRVGLKTITDVYATQARYDNAVADYIAADNQVKNDRENLRVITGTLYLSLSKLDEKFPYIQPQPANIETWVKKAAQQNWSIKAAQYAVEQKLQNIRQQFAGHLPNLNFNAAYSNDYSYTSQSIYLLEEPLHESGPTRTINKSVGVTLNLPIVQGGYVTAETKKAKYDYETQRQILEQTFRDTINITRQSYLNVAASISKVMADKQAIRSAAIALDGMNQGYSVGTKTIVDVLQQQQSLFDSQKNYARDRFNYVLNILLLKQAAGTLSGNDLEAINSWLRETRTTAFSALPHYKKTITQAHSKKIYTAQHKKKRHRSRLRRGKSTKHH
jgi:outer membrane protein